MTVESVTYISDLNATYPTGTDNKSEGDNHIRNMKTGIKTTFPNISGAMTSTHTELNILDGVTATTAQLNYLNATTGIAGGGTVVDMFASGTLMLFQQTSAPTGWTKQVTHNDKALRVVSGTASSGGTAAFTTTFGITATDSHTLVESEIPAHKHGERASSDLAAYIYTGSGTGNGVATISSSGGGRLYTDNTGGGGGHTHNITGMDIQYVDLIIASKD